MELQSWSELMELTDGSQSVTIVVTNRIDPNR